MFTLQNLPFVHCTLGFVVVCNKNIKILHLQMFGLTFLILPGSLILPGLKVFNLAIKPTSDLTNYKSTFDPSSGYHKSLFTRSII